MATEDELAELRAEVERLRAENEQLRRKLERALDPTWPK